MVLDGFALTSDKMYITDSMRWADSKGQEVWDKLLKHRPHTSPQVTDERPPHDLERFDQMTALSEVGRHG